MHTSVLQTYGYGNGAVPLQPQPGLAPIDTLGRDNSTKLPPRGRVLLQLGPRCVMPKSLGTHGQRPGVLTPQLFLWDPE